MISGDLGLTERLAEAFLCQLYRTTYRKAGVLMANYLGCDGYE